MSYNNLAHWLKTQGQVERAEEIYLDVVSRASRYLRPDHWHQGLFDHDQSRNARRALDRLVRKMTVAEVFGD